MRVNKGYFIGEFLLIITTVVFTIKLNSYNKILSSIQSRYDNKIQQALEVASHPDYFTYFLLGIIFIALLVWYTVFTFKAKIGNEILIVALINLILLIVLLIVFWNPIVTTFAVLLISGGVCMIANS